MNHRKIIPFLFVGIVSFFFLIPGCDDLVTEENTVIIYDTTLGEACFDCHSDEDNILLRPKNQYVNSRHANDSLLDLPVVINGTDYVINSCAPQCHTHEGFIRTFDSVTISPVNYNVIYCYTCHMPHTGDYDTWDADTLRAVYEYILLANDSAFSMGKSNMCAHCHQAASPAPLPDVTSDVTLTADFGPHYSGQTDILSGKGGYRFTDIEIINSHESIDTSGCLKCHYGTGQGYTFGEHTFRLEKISGVDTTHYVTNCISCHPSITNFYTVVEGSHNRIDSIASMADSLEILLKSRYYLDPDDPAGTQLMVDSVIPVDAARILYNYLLYKMEGSRGVHNPRFVEALLYESITQFDSLPPTAIFSVSATAGCAPLEVDFTDESMGKIVSWEWDFGDGVGTSESADTSYTFTTAGSYEISLTVTDTNTLGDTEIRTGYINVYSTVANFYSDNQSGCDSLDVTFYENSPSDSILTWDWDFGDGSPHGYVKNPSHTYTDIGTFDITLIVTDSCGSDDTTMTAYITVADAAPVAAFNASETTGTLPKTINFTDESTGLITSWNWDFGDGGTSEERNPSYTYDNEAGTFTVILTVSNDCGSGQEIKTDYITITE